MTNHPLVSIIIPLYNHELFIEQCLNSVLEDTYPCKEIVIIDDGSRDSSSDIVRKWHSEHAIALGDNFKFVCRENRGLTKTLNELVMIAHGELIAVLASDDYLLAGGIAARVAYLEQHPDKMAVFGDCKLVDYGGLISEKSGLSDLHDGRKKHLINPRLLSYEIVFNWCVPGPVFMARKELYSIIGGYNENIAVEDWDFYLRTVARDLLGFIDLPVAAYRIRPDDGTIEITVQQHIRFNEAMFETVKNNLPHFKGLKRAYLFGEKLKFHGVLERLRGNKSPTAFFARKTGRLMENLLKALYSAWTRLIVPMLPTRSN